MCNVTLFTFLHWSCLYWMLLVQLYIRLLGVTIDPNLTMWEHTKWCNLLCYQMWQYAKCGALWILVHCVTQSVTSSDLLLGCVCFLSELKQCIIVCGKFVHVETLQTYFYQLIFVEMFSQYNSSCELQANSLVGCAMTYSLFEYAKDNVDVLMPDSLMCSSNVQVCASVECFTSSLVPRIQPTFHTQNISVAHCSYSSFFSVNYSSDRLANICWFLSMQFCELDLSQKRSLKRVLFWFTSQSEACAARSHCHSQDTC